jgi:hypothetical protein
MFRTGCIASLCGESSGPESGPLGSPGRSSRWVSASDAEGGDRIEVAQLLRGEAVAGTVPAGHVEAQGQDGYGGGASVWHVEVAGFHAVRDDLADDLADFTLLGRDVG